MKYIADNSAEQQQRRKPQYAKVILNVITKHQQEVGTGYYDAVTQVIMGEDASTLALKGSTEEEQFYESKLSRRYGRVQCLVQW